MKRQKISDEKFFISKSSIPGAGQGLFAQKDLIQGELLKVEGMTILPDSVEDQCTYYADAYKYRVGDKLLIPIGWAAMINHSSQPNLEKIIQNEQLYLKPLKKIKQGEELLLCYSVYAQGFFKFKGP